MTHPAAEPLQPRPWRWTWTLHTLFAPLFLAAYAARYVDPRTLWWLQPLGIALPLLALAAAALALLFLARRRWTPTAAYSVCALLVAARLVPSGAGLVDRAPAAPGPTLTVMTMNAKSRTMQPPAALAAFIDRHTPDLLALQEAPAYYVDSLSVWAAAPQVRILLGRNGLTPGRIGDGHRVPTPVLSTHPWLKFERLAPILDGQTVPEGTRAEVDWHGRRLALYNVHLHSFRLDQMREQGSWISWRAWGRRLAVLQGDFRRRADEAAYLAERLRTEPRPYLLVGDLNSTPHTWVHRHLTTVAQDAYRAVRWRRGATYPSTRPAVRIDYVLTGGAWQVAAAAVGPPAGSDHRPLVVRLQYSTLHGDQ